MSNASEAETGRAKMVLEELARREALVNTVREESLSPTRQFLILLVLVALGLGASFFHWMNWLTSHPRLMNQVVGVALTIGVVGAFGTVLVRHRLNAVVKILYRSGALAKFVDGASDAGKAGR